MSPCNVWKAVAGIVFHSLTSSLLMQRVSLLSHCVPDPMAVFSASIACSRLLLGNHDKLLMQMIDYGRPLMAFATMMYSDITITEVGRED